MDIQDTPAAGFLAVVGWATCPCCQMKLFIRNIVSVWSVDLVGIYDSTMLDELLIDKLHCLQIAVRKPQSLPPGLLGPRLL